jgi:hypothetical protein
LPIIDIGTESVRLAEVTPGSRRTRSNSFWKKSAARSHGVAVSNGVEGDQVEPLGIEADFRPRVPETRAPARGRAAG